MTEQVQSILCVYAKVKLKTRAEHKEFLKRVRKEVPRKTYREARAALLSRNSLRLLVSLSAEPRLGERVESPGSFGIGGARRGVAAIWVRYHGPPLPDDEKARINLLRRTYRVAPHDIEDVINQVLGKDPKAAPSSGAPWSKLIAALARAGFQVTEDELMSAPLVVELDPDVQAELERS